MVCVAEPEFQPGHPRRIRRGQIRGVDEREVDRSTRQVDLRRLEPGLVPRGAVVRHPQVGTVRVVDGRHHRDAVHGQGLHEGGSVSRREVPRIHRAPVGPSSGPFVGSLPLSGQGGESR